MIVYHGGQEVVAASKAPQAAKGKRLALKTICQRHEAEEARGSNLRKDRLRCCIEPGRLTTVHSEFRAGDFGHIKKLRIDGYGTRERKVEAEREVWQAPPIAMNSATSKNR